VKNYGLVSNQTDISLIPGIESILLYGLGNVLNTDANCCLKLKIIKNDDYIDVYVHYDKNEYDIFVKKFGNVGNIQINPNFNSDDLFLNYGIIFDAENSKFDYMPIFEKDKILKVSCSHEDLKEFLNFENKNDYLDLIENKVTEIKNIFEQEFSMDYYDEIFEASKFFSYKLNYLKEVKECLTKFSSYEDASHATLNSDKIINDEL